jgi:uncharacterized protein with FMN-binding domain
MKKIILSVSFIGAFALYVLLSNRNSISVALPSGTGSNISGSSGASSSGGGSSNGQIMGSGSTAADGSASTPVVASQPASASVPQASPVAGAYKDGSYTGIDADAYFGKVQVKAVIQNGKLTDVQFLDYPSDRTTSKRISEQAMPVLKSEAIRAQSAQVDVVSGATQTSQGFMQSLADALSQAKS